MKFLLYYISYNLIKNLIKSSTQFHKIIELAVNLASRIYWVEFYIRMDK
jgi:hypothetical protein